MNYARVLFGSAALFNLLVALSLTLAWPWTQTLLQLDPSEGSNVLLRQVAALLILTFGIAYGMVAVNASRYRAYVLLGIVGKSLVVVAAVPVIFQGGEGQMLAALAMGDLLYVLLFADFLRRTAPA